MNRYETTGERLLHVRRPEHARTCTGDRDSNIRGLRDHRADGCVARSGVWEFHVGRGLRNRETDGRDDFTVFQRGLEQIGEKIVSGNFALICHDCRTETDHRRRIVYGRIVVG